MEFVTVRDFRNSSKSIWDKVKRDEDIIVTNNGKPTALLINISEGNFDETLQYIRRARLNRMLDEAREEAEDCGFMSDGDIDAEIAAARAGFKAQSGKTL
jgi:prevent-host-death family protein